jgi:uncharacterized lipoprotein
MKQLTYCVVLAALAGCSATPNYDQHFGDAVRQAKSAMTINPKASADPDPVTGIDGQAAAETVGRYQESFKTPPPVVNVINVGGVTTK